MLNDVIARDKVIAVAILILGVIVARAISYALAVLGVSGLPTMLTDPMVFVSQLPAGFISFLGTASLLAFML